MIISRTPFRVSFFGGGTDFPAFYQAHGGVTLSTTIRKSCYISIHRLSPFFSHRFRASYAKTESVLTPEAFEHPLVRECLLLHHPLPGIEISHVSDLPGRTGLGSSSAFTVGLLHALHTLLGHRVTAEDLAREAILVERTRVGDPGGHQDQFAAAYGGFLRIEYGPGNQVRVNRLALTASRIQEIEQHCLMFFTGLEQSADHILNSQQSNLASNEATLLRMREMADEAETILLSDQPMQAFGELLHESWTLKKTLSTGISNSFIDDLYMAARRAGATGGKLLGAGGRGFLLLSVPPDDQAAVRKALGELQEVDFSCSFDGSRIIFQDQE